MNEPCTSPGMIIKVSENSIMGIHRDGAGNSIAEQIEEPIVEKVQFSSGAYQDDVDLFYYHSVGFVFVVLFEYTG